MCSNDGAVVRDWAVAGQGVAIRSEWNVAADLAAGRLKRSRSRVVDTASGFDLIADWICSAKLCTKCIYVH